MPKWAFDFYGGVSIRRNDRLTRITPYQRLNRVFLPFCATDKLMHPQKTDPNRPNSLKIKQGIKTHDAGILLFRIYYFYKSFISFHIIDKRRDGNQSYFTEKR